MLRVASRTSHRMALLYRQSASKVLGSTRTFEVESTSAVATHCGFCETSRTSSMTLAHQGCKNEHSKEPRPPVPSLPNPSIKPARGNTLIHKLE